MMLKNKSIALLICGAVYLASCADLHENLYSDISGEAYYTSADGFRDLTVTMYRPLRTYYSYEVGDLLTIPGTDEFTADEEAAVDGLTRAPKVVFSATLDEPLTWANTTLVRDDAVATVRAMKQDGSGLLSTIGSISLCRSLLGAGLVDRFRVVMFPVITGATGAERIYDGYPDVALEMIDHRTFDGRIQLVEYRPRVLEHPPLHSTG
jgi:dihydrofolate reductase